MDRLPTLIGEGVGVGGSGDGAGRGTPASMANRTPGGRLSPSYTTGMGGGGESAGGGGHRIWLR